MKKNLLSMAALALIMAGCSSNEDDVKIDNGEGTAPVAINISQKVTGVETKAATNPIEVKADIIMIDADSNGDPDYSGFVPNKTNKINNSNSFDSESDRANVALVTFTANAVATAIKPSPTLYYPTSSSTSTFIFGVAPQGTVSNGGKVSFSTVDGYQDVMFAGKQSAGSSNSTNTVELDFAHQTAQLIFVAKLSSTDFTNTEWANKTVSVDKIIIQNAGVPNSINLSDGNIEWDTKSVDVAGCNTTLGTAACAESVPVMIKPAASVTVDLVLKLSDNTIVQYNNLIIQSVNGGNLSVNRGESHLVTFEITAPKAATNAKVQVTARVQEWTKGTDGKVEINKE